jgi:hypothetical protein
MIFSYRRRINFIVIQVIFIRKGDYEGVANAERKFIHELLEIYVRLSKFTDSLCVLKLDFTSFICMSLLIWDCLFRRWLSGTEYAEAQATLMNNAQNPKKSNIVRIKFHSNVRISE